MVDVLESAKVFLTAAEETADVEIFVRNGVAYYEQLLRSAPDLVRELVAAVVDARQAIEVVQQAHEAQLLRFAAKRAKDERKIDRLKARVTELEAEVDLLTGLTLGEEM